MRSGSGDPRRRRAGGVEGRGAQEALYTIEPPSVALGEKLFRDRCSTCHAFDHKVVGPPYTETVPKFGTTPAALVAFILQSAPDDPGVSPMPNQGLRPSEAHSAALYLLQQVQAGTRMKPRLLVGALIAYFALFAGVIVLIACLRPHGAAGPAQPIAFSHTLHIGKVGARVHALP